MARATIIVDVDSPQEVREVELWFAKWRPRLEYASQQEGCGCCIYMWNVEGPNDAIEELPREVLADSEWSNPKRTLKN